MIKNGYYYPDYLWKKTCHFNEVTGEAEGDCAFGFAVGNRRAGKSVGIGIFALADFLLYGYQTVLIRRYKDDFQKKKAMENFWQKSWPYLKEFPEIVKGDVKLQEMYPLDLVMNFDWEGHKLEFKENHAFIDDHLFSSPCALSKFNDFKNENFSNVHKLIYDEFITEDNQKLKNEVFALYNVLDTAARGRDDALNTTAVIFIANSITNVSDMYVELGIDRELRSDTKRLYRPEKGYVLEKIMNKAVAEEFKNSAVGRVMSNGLVGQQYTGYAQSNEVKDDEGFVMRLDGDMRYIVNFKYDDTVFALKYHPGWGLYYITDDGVDYTRETLALQREDHSMDTLLINNVIKKRMAYIKLFYGCGYMRFNSMRSKAMFLEMYSYM